MLSVEKLLFWLNPVTRLRKRKTEENNQTQLAEMLLAYPGLHLRVMVVGKRHIHFLDTEDLGLMNKVATLEAEVNFKWN